MTTTKITDDLIQQIVDRRRAGEFQSKIAYELGVGVATVNKYCKDAARKGQLLGQGPAMDGFEITKVTTKEADGTHITQKIDRSDEQLVLPDGHILERASLLVDGNWYKTKLAPGTLTRDDLLGVFAEYKGASPLYFPPRISDADLTTVYTTSDLHLGMLAWGKETGTPWDLKIASSTIRTSMRELVECSPKAGTGILLDMGDYTHNNNQSNTTQSGHQLDVDGRFRKIAREAIKLRMDLIGLLASKHEKVIVRSLPGNHDSDTAQILSAAFGVFFENNESIHVDDDPSEFWAHEFGVNMLFANHGHKTKASTLPRVMAGRFPEMWGRTKVKQAFSGHIHHETSGEDMGAKWKTLRTIIPGDSYSNSHGYTAGRELNSYTYHRTRGFRQEQVVQIF